ncbi:zinc-finger of a C2HC-type [Novymonas esmeraldas]|uniref:Zinc-finger of a C2HC-type n=1 Tax=Novymonas esmeraldas TaxID=1808958 RepID=A0AAW0ERR9_9TRYP
MPRPQFITCQLCGRGFGSASINIHIPQCYEKAIKRWQLNPQGPRPVLPPLHGKPAARVSNAGPSGVVFTEQPRGGGMSAARSLQTQSMPPESVEPANMNLHPCRKCGRSFNFDRVAYHESVCKGDQKRRVFDSSKQRRASGDGDDAYAGGAFGAPRSARGGRKKLGTATTTSRYTPAPAPQTNWRQQHEEFIAAIRSAKRSDAEAQSMWGATPSAPSYGSARAPARAGGGGGGGGYPGGAGMSARGPVSTKRIPPLMTKQSESIKQNIATGGRAARAKAGGLTVGRPAARPTPPAQRSSFGGGGGDRFSSRGGGYGMGGGGGGGGGGRILNDNSTSIGMLQAMGRG